MNAIERLRAAGFRCEREPLRPEDRLDAVQSRLRQTGDYYPLGRHHHFRSDDRHAWVLPPSWLAFLEEGGLRVFREGEKRPVLTIHRPLSVVLQTQDLIEALSDHRYGKWPHHALDEYGLDRCLMFAAYGNGWMTGWAFDTRIQSNDGECCIRRVSDFSADDDEMQKEWPSNERLSGNVTRFEDWLRAWAEQQT